jgi:hypothetical protein
MNPCRCVGTLLRLTSRIVGVVPGGLCRRADTGRVRFGGDWRRLIGRTDLPRTSLKAKVYPRVYLTENLNLRK